MLSVLLCMEQHQSLYEYDKWRLMQGERAISPHVRASHAREPRRMSRHYLQAQRDKRYQEFEAIKRLRTLADTVRRQQIIRKREKATKKTLARNAQNAVRRRNQIKNILSQRAPYDTVRHIDSFLGIDRYPDGGKRMPTRRRNNLRKRLARKRRSLRNRR